MNLQPFYTFASRYQDGDDLVHDAWLRCREQAADPRFGGYLIATIRNLAIDRARRNRSAGPQGLETVRDSHDPHMCLELARADRAIASLPPVMRQAMELSRAGCTHAEIARIQGTGINTALSRVRRGREAIR